MKLFRKKTLFWLFSLFLIYFGIVTYLNKELAIGLLFLLFLSGITFFFIHRAEKKDKSLLLLFLIVLLIHLATTLFIHYAQFQPFRGGEGDYIKYNFQAQEIAHRFSQGNFSLEGLKMSHYYPVVIGIIYTFTLPEMIIGQLFGVWLAAISALFVFLIVREIGGNKKIAFLIGILASIYPSYLFYGSLLLKDTLVTPLVLFGLLLILKLIKNFIWRNFLIFYIILGTLIHFRLYTGFVLLFTFIFCWLLLSKLNLRKKIIYGIIIILFLGFLPQISGYGYYGISTIKYYFNPERITYYREVVYVPSTEIPSTKFPSVKTQSTDISSIGKNSTIKVETNFEHPLKFLGNFLESYIYVLLGPFPWQMKYSRHYFALFETIPWYFLFFFIIKGTTESIKKYRSTLPLIIFSLGTLGILALFVPNFGIITRIRIPSFIALLCLLPFGLNLKNQYLNKIEKYLTKPLWKNT